MNEGMRQDIRRQPELVAGILPALRRSAAEIDIGRDRILLGGCGDGAFAAGAASAFLVEAGLDPRPATAQELAFHAVMQGSDRVVLLSVSGGTRRTLQAARRAAGLGARTLAVTCDRESALAAVCDQVLELPFRPLARRAPHTADYVATLAALAVLAERGRGRPDAELDRLPEILARMIASVEPGVAELAASIRPSARIFVLGQGSNLFTARYIAAKFHESGGLAGLAFETENFVHGANFMVEPGDLVCVLAADGPGGFRERELVPGLRRLTGQVLVIGGAGESVAGEVRWACPAVRPAMSVFPMAVAGQVLCLAIADALGLGVEEPRAGRDRGSLHAGIQRQWMTETEDGADTGGGA